MARKNNVIARSVATKQSRKSWIATSHFVLLAMTCLLAACATPKAQDYPPQVHEAALPQRHWLPKDQPKAVIVALHGFNDYSHAFEGAGKYFSKKGIAIFAYDQRGFGKAPQPGIWGDGRNLTEDLAQRVRALKHRYPKTPVYILGESMGGAVAVASVVTPGFPHVDGLILSAPALWGDGTMNPLTRALLWTGAHIIPEKTLTGSELKIRASDNIEMLRALGADPLVLKKSRLDAIYGMVQMMDAAYEAEPDVTVPILLLYGANDQVIPVGPIKAARERFTAPVDYIYYPNGYHMLLRDLQAENVMRDVVAWIADHKTRN